MPGVAGPQCSQHMRSGRPRNFRLSHRQGLLLALASFHIRLLPFPTAFSFLLLPKSHHAVEVWIRGATRACPDPLPVPHTLLPAAVAPKCWGMGALDWGWNISKTL